MNGPLHVMADEPRRFLARRAARAVIAVLAGTMIIAGLAATVVALPASFVVVGLVVDSFAGDAGDGWPPPDLPVGLAWGSWVASVATAVTGIRGGLRLLRRHRRLVLFLRRFGYDDATSVVSFAASRVVGSTWRLVTLDDAEIAPVGIGATRRRLLDAGRVTGPAIARVVRVLGLELFPAVVLAGWAIVGFEAWRSGVFAGRYDGSLDPYLEVLFVVLDGRLPLEAVGPDLVGMFAVVLTVAACSFVVMMGSAAVLLLAFPLAAVIGFVGTTLTAARDAEAARTAFIRTGPEVAAVATSIASRARKVLAPRLVVVRVATPLWRQAVTQLGTIASASLVDVSEPTENLLWEVEELTHRVNAPCVFVGQRDRVAALVAAAGTDPLTGRLVRLIGERPLLVYGSDRRSARRFARALRATLLGLPAPRLPSVTPSGTGLRGGRGHRLTVPDPVWRPLELRRRRRAG